MLEINLIVHIPDELPDEREEFELLLEKLNTAVGTEGLRIVKMEWVIGLAKEDEGDTNFCIPSQGKEFHFSLSGDINTRKVQFVLSFQVVVNALYREMVSVNKHPQLEVFGRPLVSLKNVPYVCHCSGYRKIMDKVRQAEEKDYSFEVMMTDFFRNEGIDKTTEENTSETHKKYSVERELEAVGELAAALTDAALVVVRMSRSSAGPRWQKAEELFWNGDYEAALTVLELPKIKTELRKAARENDRIMVENLIGEAMLRIRLLQVDKPDWSQRKALEQEIISIYKTCITCGCHCLPKLAVAGLMTEYARFLSKIHPTRRCRMIYERVLPEWRVLAEEHQDTCLLELARALHDYAYLIIHDHEAIDNQSRELFRPEHYLYECTPYPETVYLEELDICYRLATTYPDAVMPLWAKASYAYGVLLLGMCYFHRAKQAFSEAMDIYRIMAESDPACYQTLYESKLKAVKQIMRDYGCEAEEDSETENVKDTRMAAESGNPEAQFQMGEHYQTGNSVVKDYEEAVKWYVKAAENGHLKSQCLLGDNYWHAKWGRKNLELAVQWYRKAAMQGDTHSQVALAEICLETKEEKGYEEALWWLQEAAENENGHACFLLGQCYENGMGGVPKNYEKAALWYIKGDEESGNMECSFRLGHLYHYGKGVPQDYSKALNYYVVCRTFGFRYFEVKKQIDKLMGDMSHSS